MKLKLALASILLALGATTAQAADTRTPDILSSDSSSLAQNMSAVDISRTRGEYYTCYHPNNGTQSCHYQFTRGSLPFTEQHRYGYTTNSYVVSFNYFNGPIYVTR